MKIETKYFNGKIVETKQETRNGVPIGIIKGFIATWDLDRCGDEFVKGCFAESLREHKKKKRQVRFKGFHGHLIGGFPIDTVEENDTGLFGVGEVNLETQKGRDVFSLARQGVIVDLSIGFSTLEKEPTKAGRRITKAIVWEGSAVDEPMNEKANITEVKSAIEKASCPEELKDALSQIDYISPDLVKTIVGYVEEKINYLSEEEIKPFANEHACRLIDPGQFTSFRRQNNAATHDGKRIDFIFGIKEGKSKLQAMRYPKSTWKADNAKSHCSGKDGTFESAKKDAILLIENFKDFSDRELEEKLKSGVSFSGKNAKAIISALKTTGLRDGDDGSHRDGGEVNWSNVLAELKKTQQLLEDR